MSEKSKVSVGRKVAYGFGSIAYGVKNNGFDYFFLIFYSQVMGVSAYLVSLALLIALVIDALSDPLIGYMSDNTRSRWGRRHPFMYAAALPVAVAYYFVWNPPSGLEGDALFPYIVTVAVLVRTLITLYEIPSSSLVAEMSDDYDERTTIFRKTFRQMTLLSFIYTTKIRLMKIEKSRLQKQLRNGCQSLKHPPDFKDC